MTWRLFERFGLEIEYMIVEAARLDVLPAADHLLRAAAGADEFVGDVERGCITWSNELVLHVAEFKTTEPAAAFSGLADAFQQQVRDANRLLRGLGGRLLPGGMHPWMRPLEQTRLWPHENRVVYEAFNRIFDCHGHGWSNLQSAHLNLPFADDDEFGRLHAAIRLILPILPALAAASPVMDGRLTGTLDNRLAVYAANCARIPAVTGAVIPERAFSRDEYEDRILLPLYRGLAPFDPEGILQEEWANARGAIARFDRHAIEIRVLDAQEHPAADVAIAALVCSAVQALVAERWCSRAAQQAWEVAPLAAILQQTIREADAARIDDPAYLAALGVGDVSSCQAGDIWRRIAAAAPPTLSASEGAALRIVLDQGPLARRLLRALGSRPTDDALRRVYGALADGLDAGRSFDAPA